MFWDYLTKEEAAEYRLIIRKINYWLAYCETQRKKKQPIDYSLDLTNEEYIRADAISAKGWQLSRPIDG